MIGSTAVILFAMSLLLATRARFLEPYFGGLDKMYRDHKQAAVTGFLVLLLHVAVSRGGWNRPEVCRRD